MENELDKTVEITPATVEIQQENKALPRSGGFQTHPENINRKGRPLKGWSWSELLEDAGELIEPISGKKYKELVSQRLWIECANGNVSAIQALFDRMEGKPKNFVDATSGGEPIKGAIELAALLQTILKQNDTEANSGSTNAS
jgi:hypothetical protein